jgi:hypothetical protein
MWHADGYKVGVSLQYNKFCVTKWFGVYSQKEAFETENFVWHMRMMDAVISALDKALVGFTSVPIFS